MKKIIFFVGPPGCGKGTQAKKLAKKNHYLHVSTGDLIRSIAIDPDATEAEKSILSEVNTRGKLAPDWFICGLIFRTIERFLKKQEYKGIIFDGAIRTIEQAMRVSQYLETKDLDKNAVVVAIMISDEEAFNRLTKRRVCVQCREIIPWLENTKKIVVCPVCGGELQVRPDDKEETIKKRIKEQGNKGLMKILEYYERLGILLMINGEQTIEDVARDVEKTLIN